MSMFNIVIHMLFASNGVLAVKRGVKDKITLWCQQEKSPMSTGIISRQLQVCLTQLHLAADNLPSLVSPTSRKQLLTSLSGDRSGLCSRRVVNLFRAKAIRNV